MSSDIFLLRCHLVAKTKSRWRSKMGAGLEHLAFSSSLEDYCRRHITCCHQIFINCWQSNIFGVLGSVKYFSPKVFFQHAEITTDCRISDVCPGLAEIQEFSFAMQPTSVRFWLSSPQNDFPSNNFLMKIFFCTEILFCPKCLVYFDPMFEVEHVGEKSLFKIELLLSTEDIQQFLFNWY